MTALYQPEISTIEAQIAALQAQLANLNKAEFVSSGILQAVQDGVEELSKISSLGADAHARLKQAILNLLQGGDGNDGGNQPVNPEPTPGDDGGVEVAIAVVPPAPEPSEEKGKEDVSVITAETPMEAIAVETQQEQPQAQTLDKVRAKLNRAYPWSVPQPQIEQGSSAVVAIAVNPEPLTGQSCDWASPLASPLATPLCCQLSDTSQSALQGQSVEIACVVSEAPKKPEYIELVPVSHEVAYQRRNHDSEIICCYVGFNNKTKAKQWGEFLAVHHSVAAGFQLRNSERLTAFKYEIKLWGMAVAQIEKLAQSDLQKSPPSNFGTAPKRKVEPVAPIPKPLQIDDIEVGDIVRNTTVKNWTYVVLAKMENGMLDCQRNNTPAGTPEIRLALHPASVELVSKAIKVEDNDVSQHVSIDVNDVPVGVRLERTDDALTTEYRVWAWSIVRVKGRPEVQQKCIGLLMEDAKGISARRPHGMSTAQSFQQTFDAIKYLMQGASLKLSDLEAAYRQHQSEVAIAAIPAVTSEQAKADLFGGGYDVPALADAFGGFSF